MKYFALALCFLLTACGGAPNEQVTVNKTGSIIDVANASDIARRCLDGVVYVRIGNYGFSAKFDRDSKVETCGGAQ